MKKALFILSVTLFISSTGLYSDNFCPTCGGASPTSQEDQRRAGGGGGGGSGSETLEDFRTNEWYNSSRNVFGRDRNDNYRERTEPDSFTPQRSGGGSRDIWGDRR